MSNAETLKEPLAPGNDKSVSSRRILLVDDEEAVLWSLSQNLSFFNNNFKVGTALSAEDALDILSATSVDVLVTDLRLPKQSGLELLSSLRSHAPQTRSILMTAYGSDDVISQAIELGCFAYLEKPFSIQQLLDYITAPVDRPPLFTMSRTSQYAELAALNLLDVLQLYCAKRATISLSVNIREHTGSVIIKDGMVHHAAFRKKTGPAALFSLIHAPEAIIQSIDPLPPATKQIKQTLYLNERSIQLVRNAMDPAEELAFLGGVFQSRQLTPLRGASTLETKSNSRTSNAIFRIPQTASPSSLDNSLPSDTTQTVLAPEESPKLPTHLNLRLQALLSAGIAHFENHRYAEARKCFSSALQLDPSCSEAARGLEDIKQKNKS